MLFRTLSTLLGLALVTKSLWSWLVTAFLTALLLMAIDHVWRWEAHRKAMLRIVASQRVQSIEWCLLALGAAFLGLAAFVY